MLVGADLVALLQDSVPFQTLSTITDNLEARLENLSDNMFKVHSTHTTNALTLTLRPRRRSRVRRRTPKWVDLAPWDDGNPRIY